jgi:hyperosmotically inducible protein
MRMTRFARFLAASSFAVALASCDTIQGRETAGQYVDDTTITSRIKTAILRDPTLSVMQIGVETLQGNVQFSGFVNSPDAKEKATVIARRIGGVKSITNDLVVRQ